MDAASAFFEGRSSAAWNFDALKNLREISPVVRSHLQRVYATLTVSVLISVLGCSAHLFWNFGGSLTTLGLIGCVIWLAALPAYSSNQSTRLKLLGAICFLQGASVGPLVELATEIHPGLAITALLATVVVFGCFTGSALLARRREFLFLGGVLSSAVSTMLTLQLCAYFFGSSILNFNIQLYGGLLVFVGYILFDTQMIIERADHGDLDYVKHSLDLFVDFVAIFIRILHILTKKQAEKDRRAEKKRRSENRY